MLPRNLINRVFERISVSPGSVRVLTIWLLVPIYLAGYYRHLERARSLPRPSPPPPFPPLNTATLAFPEDFYVGWLSDDYDRCLVDGHALQDWVREQHGDLPCRPTLKYSRRGGPTSSPADLLTEDVEPSGVLVACTREGVLELGIRVFHWRP